MNYVHTSPNNHNKWNLKNKLSYGAEVVVAQW